MKIHKYFFFLILGIICNTVSGQDIKSPKEFLRTMYGEHFTPHHPLVDYANYVAEQSDKVTLIEYGQTNENRPLLLATITTAKNQKNIEKIRLDHLATTGLIDGKNRDSKFAVVWLSFGVHGNEAGGSEASMNVLYELASNHNGDVSKWLENTVILLDPSLNPDGYNRYTQWVRSIGSKKTHPGHTDREHMEPWPGGRVNHYLFDLNRDWAWQTQVESQQRITQYNRWMPHVHVDFHEMGYDDGYYFAPAAEPYHSHITDFQRNMQIDIGRNNAKYFDKEGWLYFTREVFDLFYPSYGDTWPTFNGAVGMTYEQAGHGMAGRAISLSNGDTLTIQDRIDHHTTTALATIEEASKQSERLIANFKEYFSKAINSPRGNYKSYVVKASDKADRLKILLDKNHIQYSLAGTTKSLSGYAYLSDTKGTFNMEKGDIVINANQPNGGLLQVLLDPRPMLKDSVTYDITAWSLPHAYGVETYGMTTYTDAGNYSESDIKKPACWATENPNNPAYAYVIPWTSVTSAQIMSKLYQEGVKIRMAKKDVMFDGYTIPRGAMVILRGDNYTIKDINQRLNKTLKSCETCFCLSTGFSTKGGDLGGSSFTLLDQPRVLLLSGRGTSANEVGQVWHFFDEVIKYPISIVDVDNIGRVNLSEFNTLILPDGYYNLKDNTIEDISSFVNGGGKVIAIDGALNNLVDKKDFGLSEFATEADKSAAENQRKEKELKARKDSYEDQERRGISNSIPGAIIRNEIDTSHPLAFGLGKSYHSLKTSSKKFALSKNLWNVVTVPKDYKCFGFIGSDLKKEFEETLSFGVEDKGRGKVIYMVDNPLFRGFWENGNLLFSNAVFLVK